MEAAEPEEQICNLAGADGDYERIQMTVDSGAAKSFMKSGDCQGAKVTKGKHIGKVYSSADNGKIVNEGESVVPFLTDDWTMKQMNFQRSNQIKKCLGSVGEIADKGQTVIFTRHGGAIIKDAECLAAKYAIQMAGKCTPFKRTKGVYTMDMWVKKDKKDLEEAANGERKNKEQQQERHNGDPNKRRKTAERDDEDVELAIDIEELPWNTVGPKGKKVIVLKNSGFMRPGRH